MGAKESIYQKSCPGNYYRMLPDHHEIVRKIWQDIEKNSMIHGNDYFRSLCNKYPKFLKYFSTQRKVQLEINPAITTKFTHIFEIIGYIISDYYNESKKLDKLTGYIAMVHKDMRTDVQYFLDFTSHLVDYLGTKFPDEMTPECQEELKNYLSSVSYEISSKIEDFLNYEMMGIDEPSGFLSCSPCSSPTNKLIYGQTLVYWKDRKRFWENKMNELAISKISEPTVVTSTEDSTVFKSKTEDESSEWTEGTLLSFDRQGLRHRTKMLTTDMDSTTQIGKTSGNSDFSDLHLFSSIRAPRTAGNLKKPGSNNEKLNTPKHVTVRATKKNDVIIRSFDESITRSVPELISKRQKFRLRNSNIRNSEISNIDTSKKLDDERNYPKSARQRRRMRMSSLNR